MMSRTYCSFGPLRHRSAGLILSVALAVTTARPCVGAVAAAERTFTSPEEAAEALASAWRSGGKRELLAMFGPAADALVSSGDPVAENEARKRLASSYDEAHRLNAEGAQKVVIVLGKEEWPYPIPLVKQGAAWRFDVKAGAEQIIDRRIGRNELNAIEVCRAYVTAQRGYAAKDRLGDGLREFAQRIASSEGKQDGTIGRPPRVAKKARSARWSSPRRQRVTPRGAPRVGRRFTAISTKF